MSWPMVRLKDCCEVVGGATPKREVPEYWDSAVIPWVTPKDVSELDSPVLADAPEYISEAGFRSCSTSMIPKGSVLVTSRAPIGNIAIAGRDLCTNQGFKSLIPRAGVDSLYLYYCMKHSSERLQSLGNGATFKEVSKKIVEAFEIPLPPLPEQKRIAAILDKADAIRRKRQQAIQLADDFLRAVFLDMFGDPVTNPKGFKKAPVTELADVITGFAFKSSEYVSDSKDSIRLCRGTNTLTSYFDWSDTAYWPKNKLEKLEGYLLREGDVILAMDRPWISSGLKVCIFPRKERSTYLVQRVARLRPRDLSYSDYIYSCIKSKAFEKHCCPTETTVPHISPVELKSFEILVPEQTLLQKYHSVVSALAANIQRMSDSKEESEGIFNAISQKAFSGQI